MRIFSQIIFQWSTTQDRYIRIREKSRPFIGQISLCKGASDQQTNLANSQASYYNTLTQDYGQQFQNQSNILSSLNNSLSPIINAGPNQFGFSTAETNTLNSQALQGTGQQYNNAQKALASQQAAAGGGNVPLPSGVQSAQQANLASSAANQASGQLLGIQEAGYNQGRQNYQSALGAEEGVAGMYNPTGYAGAANQGGGVANSEANTVAQLNNAASPWNIVGGILGGAAQAGLGFLTGGASTALGGLMGGGGVNGGSSQAPYGADSD